MYRTALLLALLSLPSARAHAAEVTLVFEGLESGSGQIEVDVFGESHAANFPYTERGAVAEIHREARSVREAGATLSLGDLAPGRYALFAMHDANGNGNLDRNLFGIPTEGYGFSNGATGTVGPPSFDAAAVNVPPGPGPTRIVIRLGH